MKLTAKQSAQAGVRISSTLLCLTPEALMQHTFLNPNLRQYVQKNQAFLEAYEKR